MKVLSEGMGGGMIHAEGHRGRRGPEGRWSFPRIRWPAIIAWNTRLNDEIVRRSRAAGIPMPDLNQLVATGHVSSVNYCFPHYYLLPVYGNAAAYRVRPLGPEETLFEIWTTTLMPEGARHEPPRTPTRMAWDDPRWPDVVRQDFANLPRQQAGLHSAGFEYMRLSGEVEGMISNFHRVIDGYLAGRPHDGAAAATCRRSRAGSTRRSGRSSGAKPRAAKAKRKPAVPA